MLRQNIIFVENRAGSLKKVTSLLKENNLDIYGFACFDAPEYAIFRMICNDPEKAEKIMSDNGYMNRLTPVIVVNLEDRAGGLDDLLAVLSESNINLNYIYTSFHRGSLAPVVIVYSEEMSVTEGILKKNGFRIMTSLEEFQD